MNRAMRYVLTGVMAVALTLPVAAQLADELDEIDVILDEERADEAIRRLEALVGTVRGADAAEVYWRLAQATLSKADQREDAGAGEAELLRLFEEGESYGRDAIEADPGNPLGYYWTSANIGRWGQTKGILDSLFRAPDMRDLLTEAVTRDPEHADSYYVLGQLYEQVPGVISFGNVEYSVSLGRLSVDLMEQEVRSGERDELNEDFFIQLASHLIARDWNARRRSRSVSGIRQDYRSASTPIERGFYYEGSVDIPDEDDVDEARRLLETSIRRLRSIANPGPSDVRRLEEAEELLDSI